MINFHKSNPSAYLNFLRAKYEMYKGAVEVASHPYYAGIDPSSICQLRCPTCATGVENESIRNKNAARTVFRQNRRMLRSALLDSLLKEIGEDLFLIMFYNWGEPLLNKSLPDLIAKAGQYDIYTEIHTNLSLRLSDGYIRDVLDAGLNSLCASMDGFTQETYEIYRRGGKLALARENLERFVAWRNKLGLPTKIHWKLLRFSFNEHEIPRIKRYCRQLGIQFSAVDAVIDNPDWLPRHRRAEEPILGADWTGQARLWSPLRSAPNSDASSACAWHYGYTMMSADGSVSPCCAAWHQKDDLGIYLPETGFEALWNNAKYRKSRGAFAGRDTTDLKAVQTLCLKCPFGSGVQHLYSLFDFGVAKRFYRVLKRSEPEMRRAFDLLTNARYGRAYAMLLRRGIDFPIVNALKWAGNERDIGAFVDYFEDNLSSEGRVHRRPLELSRPPACQ